MIYLSCLIVKLKTNLALTFFIVIANITSLLMSQKESKTSLKIVCVVSWRRGKFDTHRDISAQKQL